MARERALGEAYPRHDQEADRRRHRSASPSGTRHADHPTGRSKEEHDTADEAINRALRWREIERHLSGGDCLNVGCVPSKCLIRSARAFAEVRDAGDYGVRVPDGVEVDFGIADEVALWPDDRMWSSIASSIGKRPNSVSMKRTI